MILIGVPLLALLSLSTSTNNHKRQYYEDQLTCNKILRTDNNNLVSYNNTNNTAIDNENVSSCETLVLNDKVILDSVSKTSNHDQFAYKENSGLCNVLLEAPSESVLKHSYVDDKITNTNSHFLYDKNFTTDPSLFTSYLEDFDLSFFDSNTILSNETVKSKCEKYILFDLDRQVNIEYSREENIIENIFIGEDTCLKLSEQKNPNLELKNETKIKKCRESCKTVFNVQIESLKIDVEQYIKTYIPNKNHREKYMKRVNKITNIITSFDKYQYDLNEQSSPFSINYDNLEEVLITMHKKFGKERPFNREAYSSFKKDFYSCSNAIVQIYNRDWYILTEEQKILAFNCQFLKLYKNVFDMPEILTLGGVFTLNFLNDVTFIFHLINVFIEKIGKIEKNKSFIRWLIHMGFANSCKSDLDLFLIPRYHIKCHNNHINLNFFTWEIHTNVRKKINLRTEENLFININDAEIVHMKTVLLLFLYQHTIFLKYYHFNIDDIQKLRDLIQKVINSDVCFACIFDEFMDLVKKQSKNLIK